MSNIDCGACTTLRENAPDFVQNGVTDTICTSLKNDTGLNPSLNVLHTDCEDLEDVNDCLIGRMDNEIDTYDVCEWKEFMHKFVPNLYETLKAIICAICGLWTNIHSLWDRVDGICKLVNANIQPPVKQYGTLEGTTNYSEDRHGGQIENNSLINPDTNQPATNVGLYMAVLKATGCDGRCKYHFWVKPDIHFYYLDSSVNYNDVLWSVDHATVVGWGMPEQLYQMFASYPQYFLGYTDVFGNNSECTLGIYVDSVNDRLQVKYLGCIGDMRGKKFNSTMNVNYYYNAYDNLC